MMIGQNVALMLLLLLHKESHFSYAKIVSLPRQLYVLEGNNGTVRCQNRSMDEQTFYSYVSNSIWWHRDANGTNMRIRRFSGSVHSSGHNLYFNPFTSERQGTYYCCLADESACSNITVVRLSIPPRIRAVNSNYTAVVGSQVTLECNIINTGVPEATFSWNKNDSTVNNNIIVKNSSISLMLKNLSVEDSGVYTCIARAIVSNQNDSIELKVIQPIVEGNESSILKVLAEDIRTTCHIFEISVPAKLESYIYKQYNHNVTINTIVVKCNNDESVAICDLKFVGPSARSALQLFVNELSNSSKGIDFDICILRLCIQNCPGSNIVSKDDEIIDNEKNSKNLIVTILMITVIVFTLVAILLCLVLFYLRFRKTKGNIICIPMQKCLINKSSTTSLSVGTIGVIDSSSESSPSHYSALQFNYNAEHISPINSTKPGALPSYNHLTCNSGSFTSSSSFLDMHTMVSSNDDTTSNTVLQENGYVLIDDDFRRESHMHTVECNSADTQLKSEDKTNKATHKTASTVILKSDGTGIIRTGTLQALIPSPGSDENYTVTPSQTHESYFDVKVHS